MYIGGLSDVSLSAVNASALRWSPTTSLPKSVISGQDMVMTEPTYIDPSYDPSWLKEIGFVGNPWAWTREIKRPVIGFSGGESGSGDVYGPLPDGGVMRAGGPGGESYTGTGTYVMTPVREYEKSRGLTQQVAYRGTMRYHRYINADGRQVGNIREWSQGGDAIVGKIVKVVAIAMVAAGAIQAAGAVAQGVSASSTATAAPAASAAAPATAAIAPAAAAIPSTIAPLVSGAGLTTAAGALPGILTTVAKGVAVAMPLIKAKQEVKSKKAADAAAKAAALQMPIAPPANMIAPGYMPTQYIPFESGGRPAWLIPAAVGGAGLLLVLLMRRRSK